MIVAFGQSSGRDRHWRDGLARRFDLDEVSDWVLGQARSDVVDVRAKG
jgi:hypothetical protein